MPLYENLLYSMALLAMVVDLKTETIPNEASVCSGEPGLRTGSPGMDGPAQPDGSGARYCRCFYWLRCFAKDDRSRGH